MHKLSHLRRVDRIVMSGLVGFTMTLAFLAIALYGVAHWRSWQEVTALPIMPGVKLAEALSVFRADPSEVSAVIATNGLIYTLLVFAAWEWLARKAEL